MKSLKAYFICLLLLLFSPLAKGQSLVSEEIDLLNFDKKEFDFKEVKAGEKLVHKFYVTNNSDKNITLGFVEKSCNCTDVKLEKKVIKPQEKIYVQLIIDTSGKSGKIYAYTLLKANTDQKYYKVGVKATIAK